MELGELVNKYMVSMQHGAHGVKWTLSLETSSGTRHQLVVTDIENVLYLVRGDQSIYFDAKTQTLSTGWNDPGA